MTGIPAVTSAVPPPPCRPRSGKRGLAATALRHSGLGAVLRRAVSWHGVLALAYHRIGGAGASLFDHEVWSASAEAFDLQLAELKKHYDVVRTTDLADVVEKGRGRYAVITFDDGYRDNYESAYPILRAHRLPATFFVATSFIDQSGPAWWDEIAWMVRTSRRDGIPPGRWTRESIPFRNDGRDRAVHELLKVYKTLSGSETGEYLEFLADATGSGRCRAVDLPPSWMTWDMLREMRRGGMDVEGHTVNHPVLSRLRPDQQESEIAGCRARIAAELGSSMTAFSYPVGRRDAFNADTRACLQQQGVRFAFSYYGGFRTFADWDPYDLRRARVEPETSPDLFRAILSLPQVFA